MLPTARYRYDIPMKEAVLPGRNHAEMASPTPYTLRCVTASKTKDLICSCKTFHVCFAHAPTKASRFMSRDSNICEGINGAQVCPQPLDPNRLNKYCKKSLLVAMKVNYLCQLEWLIRLLEDSNFNVKVVHLVRDPRSTIHSRIQYPDHIFK